MPTRTRLLVPLVFLLLVFVGPSLLAFYTNWLWFGEVGYQQVYATTLRTQGTLFVAGFAIAVLWLMLRKRAETAPAPAGE